MEVVINGVRYVPVIESSADIKKVAMGLLASCIGTVTEDGLSEVLEGIHISVNDWGEGLPIEEVLVDIARAMGK